VTILNRTVRVQPDGSFNITNIPAGMMLVRARAICVDADFVFGADSAFFQPLAGSASPIVFPSLGPLLPTVQSLAVSADPSTLTMPGATSVLTVTATLSDGTQRNVTAGAQGTTYISSNAAIATVNTNGLVTAVNQSGTVIVSITNDGVFTSKSLTVGLGNDADNDGLPDDFELANGLNPNDPSDAGQDRDGDGLTNLQEFMRGTLVNTADTDGDGLNDGQEVNVQGTNPTNPDSDGDGLLDGNEVARGSNPLNRDSDGDGLSDGVEVALVGNPFGANPLADNDGDGLNNQDEIQLATNPADRDSDDDGLTDGEEVLAGTDPLVPDATSPVVSLTNPLQGAELIAGQTIMITANANDDGRVTRVDFLVDGMVVGTDETAPYALPFTVPAGVMALTFGATAVDTNNNVGTAPAAAVSVMPDPLTTVVGVVRDPDAAAVEGALVTTVGNRFGMTETDGSFSILDVPTILGDIVVTASATIDGQEFRGTSTAVPPVRGGTTDVGDIVVSEARFETELGELIFRCDDCFDQRDLPFPFTFFGQTYTAVFINSNGNLTFDFGEGDFSESISEFPRQPRISAFWDDIISSESGNPDEGVYVNDQLPGKFVVTWFHNQEFCCFGDNTFQIVLFSDGRIQFVYNGMTTLDAIVGITPGGNGTAPLLQVDYSASPTITTTEPTTILEQFTGDPPFDLDGGIILWTPNGGGYNASVSDLAMPGTPPVLPSSLAVPLRTLQGTVQGRVVGFDGLPLAGAELRITCSRDLSYEGRTTTDQNGHYSMAGIPAGGGVNVVASVHGEIVARGGGHLLRHGERVTIDVQPPSAVSKPER
jgi:hypothetical protein